LLYELKFRNFVSSERDIIEISSPESNDSGIQSDEHLNRLNKPVERKMGALAQAAAAAAERAKRAQINKTSETGVGDPDREDENEHDSLYSSVISNRKSSENLNANSQNNLSVNMEKQFSKTVLNKFNPERIHSNVLDFYGHEEDSGEKARSESSERVDESDEHMPINHVEQNELPLGWIRCCGK
jgi:hypothetical protein